MRQIQNKGQVKHERQAREVVHARHLKKVTQVRHIKYEIQIRQIRCARNEKLYKAVQYNNMKENN